MRLDHLLSKEHLAGGTAVGPEAICAGVRPAVALKGGTSIGSHQEVRCKYNPVVGVESSSWIGTASTLLGPEGSGDRTFMAERLARSVGAVEPESNRPPVGRRPGNRRPARTLRTAQWTRASNLCSQVSKGARWMPWHQKPMKDVGACEKPRGVGNQTLIRGCPNGETRLGSCPVTLA